MARTGEENAGQLVTPVFQPVRKQGRDLHARKSIVGSNRPRYADLPSWKSCKIVNQVSMLVHALPEPIT